MIISLLAIVLLILYGIEAARHEQEFHSHDLEECICHELGF